MPSDIIDIERATEIAQSYAGAFKRVVYCTDLPVPAYLADPQAASAKMTLFFAVLNVRQAHVGATDYIGVSKMTGAITSFGRLGE